MKRIFTIIEIIVVEELNNAILSLSLSLSIWNGYCLQYYESFVEVNMI